MLDLSQGKLTVKNKIDGMEHVFAMKGIGRRPMAMESIIAHCHVGIPEDRTIMVPNHTQNTVTFKVRPFFFFFFSIRVFSE